jgi:hypothetical protein
MEPRTQPENMQRYLKGQFDLLAGIDTIPAHINKITLQQQATTNTIKNTSSDGSREYVIR